MLWNMGEESRGSNFLRKSQDPASKGAIFGGGEERVSGVASHWMPLVQWSSTHLRDGLAEIPAGLSDVRRVAPPPTIAGVNAIADASETSRHSAVERTIFKTGFLDFS
jgi:hypothetical protein